MREVVSVERMFRRGARCGLCQATIARGAPAVALRTAHAWGLLLHAVTHVRCPHKVRTRIAAHTKGAA